MAGAARRARGVGGESGIVGMTGASSRRVPRKCVGIRERFRTRLSVRDRAKSTARRERVGDAHALVHNCRVREVKAGPAGERLTARGDGHRGGRGVRVRAARGHTRIDTLVREACFTEGLKNYGETGDDAGAAVARNVDHVGHRDRDSFAVNHRDIPNENAGVAGVMGDVYGVVEGRAAAGVNRRVVYALRNSPGVLFARRGGLGDGHRPEKGAIGT